MGLRHDHIKKRIVASIDSAILCGKCRYRGGWHTIGADDCMAAVWRCMAVVWRLYGVVWRLCGVGFGVVADATFLWNCFRQPGIPGLTTAIATANREQQNSGSSIWDHVFKVAMPTLKGIPWQNQWRPQGGRFLGRRTDGGPSAGDWVRGTLGPRRTGTLGLSGPAPL